MRKFFATTAVFLSFLIGGCVGLKSFPQTTALNQTTCDSSNADHYKSTFSYSKNLPTPIAIEEKVLETERYKSFFLSMPSSGPNGQNKNLATARYLKNKLSGPKKLILITPIYGSSTYPSSVMALRFTEWNWRDNDTNVLMIFGKSELYNLDDFENADTKQKLFRAITDSAERVKNSVIDIERFIDWAVARPEIDSKRIGIIGFSLGASVASIVAGVDHRIASGSFLMGGANFNEIFAFSEVNFLRKAQEKVVSKLGWTKTELSQKISSLLENVNPKNFAACISKNNIKILIVEATLDEYIPKSARDDLWIAWQKPERIFISASHKMAFLGMTILNFNRLDRKIFEFFEKYL